MKAAQNAALACGALVAMSACLSIAVIAAPENKAPQMTLISTDTSEPYPFAAIAVNHQVYHVTVGDVLDGVRIVQIVPDRVTLSDDEVLTLDQPAQPHSSV
jgi:hypothetical protein